MLKHFFFYHCFMVWPIKGFFSTFSFFSKFIHQSLWKTYLRWYLNVHSEKNAAWETLQNNFGKVQVEKWLFFPQRLWNISSPLLFYSRKYSALSCSRLTTKTVFLVLYFSFSREKWTLREMALDEPCQNMKHGFSWKIFFIL